MLAARELVFRAGGRALVDRVSFDAAAGELVALVGPNGAGKSTLLKMISGDLAPHAGDITFNRRPLAAWRAAERARMLAVLPQESTLAFAFSALEVALFGRYPHRAGILAANDREIALEALAAADALHLAARDFTTLSGGEKARVQLARVLAQLWNPCDVGGATLPRLMLLDEPTAALDLRHQHATLQAARDFARNQGDVAVVAVLHDLNLAAQYADRVVMLQDGRVAVSGLPADVLNTADIERVFGLAVSVLAHPDTGLPLIAARAAGRLAA